MSALWITILCVAALLGLWMALPFLRSSKLETEENASKMSIYRDQLGEVERDLASGLLSEDEADQARQEIESRALSLTNQQQEESQTSARRPLVAALILILSGAGSIAGYWYLGNPGVKDLPLEARRTETLTKKAEAGDINSRIQLLIDKVEENPDSFEDWWLLARSYASIGDNKQAANAYQRAVELSDNRPEVLSAYAESMTLANGNKVPTSARLIFEQVLNRVNDPRARYYIALAKAQNQNFDGALEDWALLAKESDPKAPWMKLVRRDIVNMARFAKKDVVDYLPDATADEIAAAGGEKPKSSVEAAQKRIAGLKILLESEPKDYKSWIELFVLQARTGELDAAKASLSSAKDNFAAAPFVLGKIDEAAASVGLDIVETSPTLSGPTHEEVAAASQLSQSEQADMIEGMVAGLAAKLEDNPDNPDGWVMLVRSYRVLGSKDKAEKALAQAEQHFKSQPTIWEQIVAQAAQ